MWGRCDHRVTLRYIFLCVWSNVTFKRTVFVASEGFVSSVIVFLFLFRVKRTLPLGCDRVWSVSQVIILLPRRLLLKRNRLQTSHHRYTHMPAYLLGDLSHHQNYYLRYVTQEAETRDNMNDCGEDGEGSELLR